MRTNVPVYLDYAATTPVCYAARQAMASAAKQASYNPSSAHMLGQSTSHLVEEARGLCARAIGARSDEIVFTSGGTEAIALAFNSVRYGSKKHIVVSAIEHDAALANARLLSEQGFTVDYVYPDASGIITETAIENAVTENTALVCVMTVNNIVGSIQPIERLAAAAHKKGALFFTDAVQAVNSIALDVKKSGVDMLCVSGHKFYAPKGVGFLYVKKGVKISPLMVGGEQEGGMRAGTQNVLGIVGMGASIERAVSYTEQTVQKLNELRAEFLSALSCGRVVQCSDHVPEIVSIVFDGVNAGRLAVAASCAGVCISVGSACSAGSATVPPTLKAMRVKNADCAVRISFGMQLHLGVAKRAGLILRNLVETLRSANS